jgi:hypothetical protein
VVKQLREGLELLRQDCKVLEEELFETKAKVTMIEGSHLYATKYLLLGRGWNLKGNVWYFNWKESDYD